MLHENLNGATLRKSCLALNQEFIRKLAFYFFLRWAHFAVKCNEWTQQQFFCPNWWRKVKIHWTASLFSFYCSTYFLATSRNKETHDNKRHLLFSVALSSYDRKTKFEPDTILKPKKYVIYALFYIFHFLKSHSTFSYLSVFLT